MKTLGQKQKYHPFKRFQHSQEERPVCTRCSAAAPQFSSYQDVDAASCNTLCSFSDLWRCSCTFWGPASHFGGSAWGRAGRANIGQGTRAVRSWLVAALAAMVTSRRSSESNAVAGRSALSKAAPQRNTWQRLFHFFTNIGEKRLQLYHTVMKRIVP